MREGYKATGNGEIPKNWEDLTFGDLVKFSGGAQPPRNTFVFEPQEGYIRLIQTRDYKSNKYQTFIPENLARKTCTKDDIMIGRYGPPIFQILRGLEGAYNVALIKAIPDDKKILKEYLYFYITQYKVWAFVDNLSQRSGGQTGVDLDKLKSYPLPLPPFPEQEKIAEILSTVDEKIIVINEQIEQTQELKKGLMQRLLTKGIGHTKFKPSPLGEIPESWEVVKVGNVARLQGGFAFKSNDAQDEGVRWLKIANVSVGKISWSDSSYLPFGFDEKYPTFQLRAGDIVIAMTRPLLGNSLKIAKIKPEDEGCLLNQRVGRIIGTNKIELEFLYQVINSLGFINKIQKELLGTDPPNISSTMFEELEISLPPLPEQAKIAETLSTVDEKLEVLQEKKEQYQEMKKGLMQQLLTGKLRVNHLIEQPELA